MWVHLVLFLKCDIVKMVCFIIVYKKFLIFNEMRFVFDDIPNPSLNLVISCLSCEKQGNAS